MTQHRIVLASLALFATLGFAEPSAAEDAAGNGRYVMSPTSDGFLKLDSRTGEVSECKRQASGFQCTLVADERTAMQQQIDKLSQDNASLRDTLASNGLRPPAPLPGSPSTTSPGTTSPNATTPTVPSDREFDHAMDLMERFLRRFMAIVKEDPKPPSQL